MKVDELCQKENIHGQAVGPGWNSEKLWCLRDTERRTLRREIQKGGQGSRRRTRGVLGPQAKGQMIPKGRRGWQGQKQEKCPER